MSQNPRTITAALVAATVATYYLQAANSKGVVKKLTFCNTTAGALTFTVHLVPSGGTASATNMIGSVQPIAANETIDFFQAQGQTLQAGATIQALASAATSISITGSVLEIV